MNLDFVKNVKNRKLNRQNIIFSNVVSIKTSKIDIVQYLVQRNLYDNFLMMAI